MWVLLFISLTGEFMPIEQFFGDDSGKNECNIAGRAVIDGIKTGAINVSGLGGGVFVCLYEV